jgi:enamine deaminase RidA (YjgF/YER057c/UK114 family)
VPDTIDGQLSRLGLQLPTPMKPVANFVPCVQSGNLLFISGQITSWNGELRYLGKVGRELSLEQGIAAAQLCALNLLAQVKSHLGNLDRVARVSMVQVFVNAVPEFTEHPAVANGASDLIVSVFGETVGRHARFAVGAGSLPFDAAVEIAATLEVR